MSFLRTQDEIRKLAEFLSVPLVAVESELGALRSHLENYCELALSERGLEIITAGKGPEVAADFAARALETGLSPEAAELFLECERRFPGRHLGFKRAFGAGASRASVYVRFKASKRDVLPFLKERVPGVLASLEAHLEGNDILYGFGFFGEARLGMKTYVLRDLAPPQADGPRTRGFLSYRWIENRLAAERKEYFPAVLRSDLAHLGGGWPRLLDFLRDAFRWERADHLGVRRVAGEAPSYKLYWERIGHLPTDFAAV